MCLGEGGAPFLVFVREEQAMVTTAEMAAYVSPARAAREIRVADSTLRMLVKRGELPAVRTPIGIIVHRDDVTRVRQERAEKGKGND